MNLNLRPSLRAAIVASMLVATGCSDDEPHGGRIDVEISGEDAAVDGFLFPSGSDVTFRDGWEIHFSHVIVTIDDVTLSENPDKAPTDQSQTDAPVARLTGPWAVDLAVPGTVPGAGGEGLATPLASIASMNLRGGADFAADQRYAFGYRIVRATADARRVNFTDDETEALYARMAERGDAVLYAGTASFVGEGCASSDDSYDFGVVPASVPFELGFATPASYVNCQNQENQGAAFDGEEYQRGLAIPSNRPAVAQITLHLEHPFFSDTVHDSAVYFDQLAAQLVGVDSATTLTTRHLSGVDPTAFTDASGTPLPWRECVEGQEAPPGKQRSFGVGHVLVDPKGDPREAFRDYLDYVSYLQSTQGHLNGGEGLCYVDRDYPSPP